MLRRYIDKFWKRVVRVWLRHKATADWPREVWAGPPTPLVWLELNTKLLRPQAEDSDH